MNIILDLCGGTGSWSLPWKQAGYDTRVLTLPHYDVTRAYFIGDHLWLDDLCGSDPVVIDRRDVLGILAAPPCTMFSYARTNAKTPRDLEEGMRCVRACLGIIWFCMEIRQDTNIKTLPLKFWALENPYFGMLKKFIGKPAFTFDPWEFGDGYQKRTALWGNFSGPKKNPIPLTDEMKRLARSNSYLHTMDMDSPVQSGFGNLDRRARRSITPQGFAKAFYEANK